MDNNINDNCNTASLEELELIHEVYCHMDLEDAEAWSLEEAKAMVEDQKKIDAERGAAQRDYDVSIWYEFIADLIEADRKEGMGPFEKSDANE